MHLYRTHTCGELQKTNVGETVKLSGWVHRKRDHGNLLFIDIRDHYGITQLVVNNEAAFLESATHVRYESVITITGQVVARIDETVNNNLATGTIEVAVETFIVESEAAILPIQVNSDKEFPEATRLKNRFLDLRREKMHNNIILRSQVIAKIREKMTAKGFMEFQTPILTASSPEGARDYLVPSRVHPGKFYALPQAPQQFKQLLMVSGFDKYFQIAPCFRDEDARADRSPGEFYQLDIEMSYVTQEDVFNSVEPVLREIFEEFSDKEVTQGDFPHITYAESMLKYGCDKPDLRNPILLSDATEVFVGSGFGIFTKSIEQGKVIRAIPAPKTSSKPRSFFDKRISYAQQELGAGGLAYIIFDEEGKAKGPIAKFLSEEKLALLKETAGLNNGDSVFFACDKEDEAAKLAGHVRNHLGEVLELIDPNVFKFCWVVDFPFFEWNEDEDRIDFSHNPFSMPQGGYEALTKSEDKDYLLSLRAFQYDIVCNGIELSSGAIRNHKPEIMYKAFELAGYDASVVDDKFGGMIRAFKFGAPPHGGIAPGVDRMVMLLADEPNIREIICFPMNQNAEDLLMNAPAEIDFKQLRELNLQLSAKARQVLEDEKNKAADNGDNEEAVA